MVQRYDLTGYQGSNLFIQITAKDSNGNPIDLTNYTVSGYVREKYSSTGILLNLSPVIDPSHVSGYININVPSTDMAALPITQGVYDIEIYSSGLDYGTKVIRGYFNIEPESTR